MTHYYLNLLFFVLLSTCTAGVANQHIFPTQGTVLFTDRTTIVQAQATGPVNVGQKGLQDRLAREALDRAISEEGDKLDPYLYKTYDPPPYHTCELRGKSTLNIPVDMMEHAINEICDANFWQRRQDSVFNKVYATKKTQGSVPVIGILRLRWLSGVPGCDENSTKRFFDYILSKASGVLTRLECRKLQQAGVHVY